MSAPWLGRRVGGEQWRFRLGNHRGGRCGGGLLRGRQRSVFALLARKRLQWLGRGEHRRYRRGGLWDQFVEQLRDSCVGIGIGECRIGQQIIDFCAKPALLTRRYRVRTDRHIPPLCHLGNRAFPVSNLKLSL